MVYIVCIVCIVYIVCIVRNVCIVCIVRIVCIVCIFGLEKKKNCFAKIFIGFDSLLSFIISV